MSRSNCLIHRMVHLLPSWRSSRCCAAGCMALLWVLAARCFGQQPATDLSNASLEDLGKIQVYSASRHLQEVKQAPSAVTIITADEIRKYGYRTLADILRSVSGFYVTYDRNYSFVGVRGFGRLGDWNSRILVLIDGHRTNNNVFGQAMVGTESLIDVDLIERVEIVRGASSSLYGANAFFAVINVITRKAPKLKNWEFSFEPASFSSYKERASYGGQYRGLDYMLSGTFYNSQGQTLFFPEFDTSATNGGITRHTDDENSQHIVATLSYGGFTLQGLFSARDKGTSTAYFGTIFNDPRTRNFDDQQYFDLSYQHAVAEKWQLEARTSYDQSRLQAPLAYASGPQDGFSEVETFSERGNWWSGEVKLSGTVFHKHRLTVGSEVIDNLRQDQGDFVPVGNSFTTDLASSTIWALYAQDEFAITRKLSLSAGVRYDRYSDFGGTTNPRLGLIYQLFAPTTLKLLYGHAFRAPDVFEMFPDLGALYDDNPQLKPEIIRSEEVIVEQNLGQHFKLSGNLFRNDIDGLISLVVDPNDGHFVNQNSGSDVAKGAAIELAVRSRSGLEGRVSYDFTHVVGRQPEPVLPNSPQHLGKANLILPLLKQRLFAGLEEQYMSSRLTLLHNRVGGFAVSTVTLLGHAFGNHMDLSASVYNLLDRRYSDPGRPEDPEDAIQQDGRSFRVGLTTRF